MKPLLTNLDIDAFKLVYRILKERKIQISEPDFLRGGVAVLKDEISKDEPYNFAIKKDLNRQMVLLNHYLKLSLNEDIHVPLEIDLLEKHLPREGSIVIRNKRTDKVEIIVLLSNQNTGFIIWLREKSTFEKSNYYSCFSSFREIDRIESKIKMSKIFANRIGARLNLENESVSQLEEFDEIFSIKESLDFRYLAILDFKYFFKLRDSEEETLWIVDRDFSHFYYALFNENLTKILLVLDENIYFYKSDEIRITDSHYYSE